MLTQKQLAARKVYQTLYLPLHIAERVDKIAHDSGMSRNELINKLIVIGLDNQDKILETALMGEASKQSPPAPTPTEEPELTFSEERSEP
jgi:hypothetical protein